jgi:hypothetical protein
VSTVTAATRVTSKEPHPYEFAEGILPNSTHDVRVGAVSGQDVEWSDVLRARTLPDRVPAGLGQEAFNVLLVSCFYRGEDKAGAAGRLVSQLGLTPDLTLLLGDQVYLDLPTGTIFSSDIGWLADKFENDYINNWSGQGYAEILHVAPTVSVPDDHEYWNNAPHASPFIPPSYTEDGRSNWLKAAKAMYDAFQLSDPGGHDRAVERDVPPLSFFLMDTRTFRSPDQKSTVHPCALKQFREWAERISGERFGVVVTGQSLFQQPAGWLKSRIVDRHLADYGDYSEIMRVVMDLAGAHRPVLCITRGLRPVDHRHRTEPGPWRTPRGFRPSVTRARWRLRLPNSSRWMVRRIADSLGAM